MTKFRLKGHSQEEIENKIKKKVSLEKNEKIIINVIKKPRKFLFIKLQGEYEVIITKKEIQKENRKKVEKKIEKKTKEVKEQNSKKVEKKIEKNENKDNPILNRLNIIIKEFIAHSNLDIKIKKINLKDKIYYVELDGNDIKYLIGERGIGFSSLEYIIMSFPEFKDIKVYFDSNNFKEKREQSLRELAIKTANQVLKTNKKSKLNPMPSRERRIIHEEISKIDGLETKSVGIEPKRYLIIKPKNNK